MVKYLSKNVNPKNKKTTDCVVRALTEATGKDYYEVLDELVALTKKTGWFMNEKRLEDKFLEQNGFVKYKQPRKFDNTKYLVGEIDQVLSSRVLKKCPVIIRCAGHLTCVMDGTLVDIWDCRYKCISNYYVKM